MKAEYKMDKDTYKKVLTKTTKTVEDDVISYEVEREDLDDLIPGWYSMVDEIFDRIEGVSFSTDYLLLIDQNASQELQIIASFSNEEDISDDEYYDFYEDGISFGTVYVTVNLLTYEVKEWHWERE